MSIGSWLVAEGYAELEMRRPGESESSDSIFDSFPSLYGVDDRRKRR